MAEKTKRPKNKKIFTLFLISVFSLLIAMTSQITDRIVALIFQVVLIFAQVVILKNLLDNYYGDEEEN